MTEKHWSKETLTLHGGQDIDSEVRARAIPIYRSTAYLFEDSTHAKELFSLEKQGFSYSRISNPTNKQFEKRVALLEGGTDAVAVASGAAAITMSILNIASAGDEIIASTNLYGDTYTLFTEYLPRYGITTRLVDCRNLDQVRDAITDKTKAIFGEVVGNPSLEVLDIEAIAKLAHEHGIPLLVDATFASPFGANPIEWGADVVIHSATKWIGGHGTVIGGIVVDAGKFNYNSHKFPYFTKVNSVADGVRFAVDYPHNAFAMKLRVQLVRAFGPSLSPDNAFQLIQGLETLHLRIPKHSENALAVAEFLENHPSVDWVSYPGLISHSSHHLAKKYLKNGSGSMVVFGIKGGKEAGKKCIDSVQLWSHVANVGDAKSLMIHPASTTHAALDEEALKKSGVTEDLIRLSVGLENVHDIISDLKQAIEKASPVTV